MLKDAKIFIAGVSGMVGSAIVRRLLAQGYTNLIGSYHSRRPEAGMFGIGEEEISPALHLVQLDLTRGNSVERFFAAEAPQYVFLAAARVGGIHANNTYPAQFIHENIAIQDNVIHSAYRNKTERLLFLGSSCIYPREAPQPMKEEHLLSGYLEPTNEPYAIAKIAGIKMCESYNRQYGTCFMAAMPTNLYGPNDNFDLENSHVLPALVRKFHLAKLASKWNWDGIQKDVARFGPIPQVIKDSLNISDFKHSTADQLNSLPTTTPCVVIWGTGKPRREFLHVDDMADACVFIMNLDDETVTQEFQNYPKPCFVNVGSGVDNTIGELAEIIQKVVGFGEEIVFDRSKPDGTPQKLLDVSRLAGLGWRSSIGLVDGVRQTYQWYRNRV